jgi:predicted PurR-regulated permease PerM
MTHSLILKMKAICSTETPGSMPEMRSVTSQNIVIFHWIIFLFYYLIFPILFSLTVFVCFNSVLSTVLKKTQNGRNNHMK